MIAERNKIYRFECHQAKDIIVKYARISNCTDLAPCMQCVLKYSFSCSDELSRATMIKDSCTNILDGNTLTPLEVKL